jgi:hypothetical protein
VAAAQPGPPPLPLPTAASTATPAGPVDGTWTVGAGSVAGFRIRQHVLGKSSDIVGRTSAVTGAVVAAHGQLTAASFRIDLTTVKVEDKPSPQFAQRLDTRHHPSAMFVLIQRVPVGSDFDKGASTTATATGSIRSALPTGASRSNQLRSPRLPRRPLHGRVPAVLQRN